MLSYLTPLTRFGFRENDPFQGVQVMSTFIRLITIIFLLSAVVALVSIHHADAQAPQPAGPTAHNHNLDEMVTKAHDKCAALWLDHAFDPLRGKIPLGVEEPSSDMLANSERLGEADKPLVQLVTKALERCRDAYAPVVAKLPPQIKTMVQGAQREQHATTAGLHAGKITVGQYSAAMSKLNAKFVESFSRIRTSPQPAALPPHESDSAQSAVPPGQPPAAAASQPLIDRKTSQSKLALVIGNSTYSNLSKLTNPVNDAKAIAALLNTMGFTATVALDTNEQALRREMRTFANHSTTADIALVFYAGHGAQIAGENYLLPTDLDIPNTETDIQLGAIKVDDLVNSIHSRTKIVLLDACRDNPVLFKNLVSGRGSRATGLAPTDASHLDQAAAGGGIFIAYATGAGSVASDGALDHSPFSLALIHNIAKPISIDDLFSLVTREVLLTTKNMQRPYKYASLEGIVCLAPSCAAVGHEAVPDIIAEVRRSEDEAFEVALRTNNPDAIATYLADYPSSPHRDAAIHALSGLKLAEFGEWTLFGITNNHYLHYLKLNSIKVFGSKVAYITRYTIDPSLPYPRPDSSSTYAPSYAEDQFVLDCRDGRQAAAHHTAFSESGTVLFTFKWADPEYLDLSMVNANLSPGSVAFTAKLILCNDNLRTPLVFKQQLSKMDFLSLSSTPAGDGELFYLPVDAGTGAPTGMAETLLITKLHDDRNLASVFAFNVSFPPELKFRLQVNDILINCSNQQIRSRKAEFYDSSNKMVFLAPTDDSNPLWEDAKKPSPLDLLRRIVCEAKDTQK
jgi:hypothetical protein